MTDSALIEALAGGVICVNAIGECLWWNSEAQSLLDLKNHPPPPSLFEVIPQQKLRRFFAQPSHDLIELNSPIFVNRKLSLTMRPYQKNHSIIMVRDITHVHTLDNIRKNFIANVSHELRTPLTVLQGYLEILQDSTTVEPQQCREILLQMSEQSKRMKVLVEDLLLLSRLESVEPDISQHQSVNVAGMIRMIYEDAKALSGQMQHQFTLQLDDHLEISAQPEELYSAFSNLIFNAVHYTQKKGEIKVSWFSKKNQAILLVEDNGMGIEKENIPKLTQRFYRANKARSRKQSSGGGTGLGLAIVKHVLIRHHAELHIESRPGVGSQFYCYFPLTCCNLGGSVQG